MAKTAPSRGTRGIDILNSPVVVDGNDRSVTRVSGLTGISVGAFRGVKQVG
jgi:hypothetical protein